MRLARKIELGLAITGIVVVSGLLAYVLFTGASSAGGPHSVHGQASVPPTATTPHGDGLSDSHDGFRLVAERLPQRRGSAEPVSFDILDRSGRPLTEYRVNQSKLLHLIVVRDDTHAFQHVHPRLDGHTWRAKVSVPDGGQYRMFAEFVPKAGQKRPHPVLLGAPFIVPGDTTFVPLPAPTDRVKAGEYVVTRPDGPAQPIVDRRQTLRFKITDARGQPAELQTYLDSYAHITAFNAMTLAAAHLHPVQRPGQALPDGELLVHATFQQRGEHRIFLEFKAGGKVRTAAFTLFVT